MLFKSLLIFLGILVVIAMFLGDADTSTQDTIQSKNSEYNFEIHFLDVGQGDSALVLCDGQAMLIDGGESNDSSLIYAYLKEHSISHLDYIVASHCHDDHIGGLPGALNYATVGKALCPVTDYDSEEFDAFKKYLNKQNATITVPNAGDTFALGSSSFEIIAPQSNSENHNDNSIVLRFTYGDTSFLFTGDAEYTEENQILSSGRNISSTVLKVGHHGSLSSTSNSFLKKVSPNYAVISVGRDNAYGFPDQLVLDDLREANIKVIRTDMQGTIICKSNGKDVLFYVERNANANTVPTATPEPTATPTPALKTINKAAPEKTEETYVLNKNTKKFHETWCSSVKKMKESNKSFFTGTRDEVIRKGYSPCGNCKP